MRERISARLVRPNTVSPHADLAEGRLIKNIKASGTLRRSAASHRGSSSSAIGDTATQDLRCQPILSRHYASITQDGLQIAGNMGGRGWFPPPASISLPY